MTRLEKFRLESDILQKLYDVYDTIAKYLIEGENRYRIICYIIDQNRVIHHYKEGLFPIQEGLENEHLLLDNSIIYDHFTKLVDVANDIYKTKAAEPASWNELIMNVRYITYKLLDVFPMQMCIDDPTSAESSKKSSSSRHSVIADGAFESRESLTTIDLSGVKIIGNSAFGCCTKLTSITNSDKVTSIGGLAFWDCKFTTIDLPRVESIGNGTFFQCSSLTTASLPNAISIGNSAFSGCTSLTTIDLSNAEIICYAAFHDCTSLTTIDLPNVTSIDNMAFSSCTSLTTINIPKVTSIGYGAFQGCKSLTTIYLPNVTSIGYNAFRNCTKLTAIHFSASNRSKIKALNGYSNKFDATKAKIYFDL